MIAVFRNDCPSLRTIERWYLEFKHGSFSLDHNLRPGRPFEVSTPESTAAVQIAMEEDRSMTQVMKPEYITKISQQDHRAKSGSLKGKSTQHKQEHPGLLERE